ncbi:MAG: nitroreductase family protein [Chitinophagaceae bacterium]|nr:nitroreductase family protein [Chitinophagaceae bacterium]
MSFLEKMQSRYTVKKYNPDGIVDNTVIEQLKEILRLSPSSINSQPWKFTFVTNSEAKAQLAEVSLFNKEKVIGSQCVIVFQVLKKVEDFEKQAAENLPEGQRNYFLNFLKPKGEAAIQSWMSNQVYISLGVLMSACGQMGIGCTPMEGINADRYDAYLKQDAYKTLFAVCIGEGAGDDTNRLEIKPKSRLKAEKVIEEI